MVGKFGLLITKIEEDCYFAHSVDFDCLTSGCSREPAIEMGKDMVNLMAYDLEDRGEKVETPKTAEQLDVPDCAELVFVDVDTVAYKQECEAQGISLERVDERPARLDPEW